MRRAAWLVLVTCGGGGAPPAPSPNPRAEAPWIHVEVGGDPAMQAGMLEGLGEDPAITFGAPPPGADGFRVVGRVDDVAITPLGDGRALLVCEASIMVTREPGGAMIARQSSSGRVAIGGSEAAAGEADCVRSVARFLVDDELRPLLHQRMLDR